RLAYALLLPTRTGVPSLLDALPISSCGCSGCSGRWCSPSSGSSCSGAERRGTGVTDIDDEIDFEVDAADLDQASVVPVPSDHLSLLVNDLHVSYRVFGAKKVGHGPVGKQSVLGRLLRRGAPQAKVREVKAVRGISFSANHGESIGIIG